MKKKKLLWTLGILLALVVLATAVGPSIVLAAVRQPEPAESYAYSDCFYDDYEDIRAHIQDLSASHHTVVAVHQRTRINSFAMSPLRLDIKAEVMVRTHLHKVSVTYELIEIS